MTLTDRIRENRSTVIMIVLVAFSLTSLASGNRATWIRTGVGTAVFVVAQPFLIVLKGIEGGCDYMTGLVVSYNATRDETQRLQKDLAKAVLHGAKRKELQEENRRLRRMMNFERSEPKLTLQPVEVIERFEGKLVIDHGSTHGIRESMAAVTPSGVVGMVIEVGFFTANILTLNDAECNIAAMVQRNRVRGIVRGTGGGEQLCRMQYIDLKDAVRKGDRIVTSPESTFPSGLVIGVVTDVDNVGALQKMAYIAPAVDPTALDEVFIVRRAEVPMGEMAGTGQAVAAQQRATAMPYDRSPQEQYAP